MRALPQGLNEDLAPEYVRFVTERHAVYEQRLAGKPAPWTDDEIIAGRKFTNVFRVLDAMSQWPLANLYDAELEPIDLLTRILVWRWTNHVPPMEYYRDQLGNYPLMDDVLSGEYARVLTEFKNTGGSLWCHVYRFGMTPGLTKIEWTESVLRDWIAPDGRHSLFDRWMATDGDIAERVRLLSLIPNVSDFISMQVSTDAGYTDQFASDENTFIVAGPGCRAGAKWLTRRVVAEDVIDWAHAVLAEQTDVRLRSGKLVREPSLMDTQNTLCEFDKYMRAAMGSLTGTFQLKPYVPQHRTTEPILPNHWA